MRASLHTRQRAGLTTRSDTEPSRRFGDHGRRRTPPPAGPATTGDQPRQRATFTPRPRLSPPPLPGTRRSTYPQAQPHPHTYTLTPPLPVNAQSLPKLPFRSTGATSLNDELIFARRTRQRDHTSRQFIRDRHRTHHDYFAASPPASSSRAPANVSPPGSPPGAKLVGRETEETAHWGIAVSAEAGPTARAAKRKIRAGGALDRYASLVAPLAVA